MSRPRRRNPKDGHKPRRPAASFWSDAGYAPSTPDRIRPTPDPAALVRSLGDPPLTPDTAAEHHLAVVYEQAVRAATALAAANGLLDEADPAET
jgi:hypothetical protein